MHNYSMQLARIGCDISARISYLAVLSIATYIVRELRSQFWQVLPLFPPLPN